jgi:hypothetical protein
MSKAASNEAGDDCKTSASRSLHPSLPGASHTACRAELAGRKSEAPSVACLPGPARINQAVICDGRRFAFPPIRSCCIFQEE